jgi:ABC-2 type transport system permease protein
MSALFRIEFGKLAHLSSLRFSLLLLALFPLVWAYAPGVFNVYGFYVVSGYQVPALALLSSMEFMLPLLVAIASAELLGLELTYGTLKTILLRPVTRSQWILMKLLVAAIYPFLLLGFFLLVALVAGVFFGFGEFIGGTGLGTGGVLGTGVMTPGAALAELVQAYVIAAFSLVPISLLAVLFTVLFMNAASGALATLAVIIFMHLLIVFPGLEPFLLTSQLSAYVTPVAGIVWVLALIGVYSFAFAALAMVLFERKDF